MELIFSNIGFMYMYFQTVPLKKTKTFKLSSNNYLAAAL